MTTKVTITNVSTEPGHFVEIVFPPNASGDRIAHGLGKDQSWTGHVWQGMDLTVKEGSPWQDCGYIPNAVVCPVDPADVVEYGCPPHQPDQT